MKFTRLSTSLKTGVSSARRLAVVLVTSTSLGVAAATASEKPKDTPKITDENLSNRIEHVLITDSALMGSQLDAKASQGIVTLSGSADDLMSKERAARLAQSVRGVRSVVNTIALKTPSRTDEEIRKDIEGSFLYDAATDAYQLTPEVKDGIVTLEGSVNSTAEKQLAIHLAKSISGVKDVKENISVKDQKDRADAEILAEVNRLMDIDARLASSSIEAKVKDGVVTLTGSVNSPLQRHRAVELASAAGSKSVKADGLKIGEATAGTEPRQQMDDAQVQDAVVDALMYDPRVLSFNPVVKVKNGVVTLTGEVDNLRAKRAAEQDARNTVGVSRVKNMLKVRPVQQVADDVLEENIESAFLRDSVVESYDIDTKADNGVVTLTGTVHSYYEKALAEDLASRANGVVSVRNNLFVSSPALVYYSEPYWGYSPFYTYWDSAGSRYGLAWPNDSEIKDDIDEEMFWSPFVDADEVTVLVENGEATLAGTVDSWAEYHSAIENAYEGGATRVKSNLTVE